VEGIAGRGRAEFSIDSRCHCFGRRRFATDDRSRDLAWLAAPSMGGVKRVTRERQDRRYPHRA
jgi:hypothetical protein